MCVCVCVCVCVCQVLGLPEGALVRELPLRSNLRLNVLHMEGGAASGRAGGWLLSALKDGGVLANVKRVVVYVAFQVCTHTHAHTRTHTYASTCVQGAI